MAQVKSEQKRCRKIQNLGSLPESKYSMISNNRHASESRMSSGRFFMKKRFLFVKLKGLGCKGTSSPVSTPAIIRSAAEWEAKDARNKNQRKRKPLNARNGGANVVVDVPHVCCTPPGIGIASDFAPRTRNPAPRIDHRKHPREARRNEDDSAPAGSRVNHRSAEEILEMMMSRQALLTGGILQGPDRYHDWRLNVEDMPYEELLDLGERIGYVGTGLQEEEISSCLRKLKHTNHDSSSLLIAVPKCSICQEKCTRNDDTCTLKCGHHHHVECIKQWLLKKNTCPVCKSSAAPV